jgi:hypothetical protein
MKKTVQFNLFMALLLYISLSMAGEQAYLCGSDEDGCSDYRACACIPYDPIESNQPYCLDFDEFVCKPLKQNPDCYPLFVYPNHGECLATMYQSRPRPACPIVGRAFCLEHRIVFCNANGAFSSCV